MTIITNRYLQSYPGAISTKFLENIFKDVFDVHESNIKEIESSLIDGKSVFPCSVKEYRKNDIVDRWVYKFAVAGISKDNIKIEVKNGSLLLEITKSGDEKDVEGETSRYLYSNLSHREMKKEWKLDKCVDEDAIKSTCIDGILTITIPVKRDLTQVKKITIE